LEREHFTMTSPRCELCGDVIGVYEPLIYVHANGVHKSSRAADPNLEAAGSGSLYHAACYEPSSGVDMLADA
jgi:hypothetical protein